jgi:hypothetical protein
MSFITLCNAMIIRYFRFYAQRRVRVSVTECSGESHPRRRRPAGRSLAAMTLMCLAAAFSFLVLTFPSVLVLRPYSEKTANVRLAMSFGSLAQFTNNSINFILYCVTGTNFRRKLSLLFDKGAYIFQHKIRRRASVIENN